MHSKVFRAYFLFTMNFCFLASAILDLRNSAELDSNDDNDQSNETYFLEQALETDSTNTSQDDVLFWEAPTTTTEILLNNQTNPEKEEEELKEQESINETTNDTLTSEKLSESLEGFQMDEEDKQNDALTNAVSLDTMDEKITLQRSNCHLEIMVQETRDLKIQISFGKLENNTSGKCGITLSGDQNTLLAVLISNLHLYQNGEILQVIVSNYGADFILKEYSPGSNYQPLILTETHRVFIVLQYKVTNVPLNQQDSRFNLEVFSYHKYANYVQREMDYFQEPFFTYK